MRNKYGDFTYACCCAILHGLRGLSKSDLESISWYSGSKTLFIHLEKFMLDIYHILLSKRNLCSPTICHSLMTHNLILGNSPRSSRCNIMLMTIYKYKSLILSKIWICCSESNRCPGICYKIMGVDDEVLKSTRVSVFCSKEVALSSYSLTKEFQKGIR